MTRDCFQQLLEISGGGKLLLGNLLTQLMENVLDVKCIHLSVRKTS